MILKNKRRAPKKSRALPIALYLIAAVLFVGFVYYTTLPR